MKKPLSYSKAMYIYKQHIIATMSCETGIAINGQKQIIRIKKKLSKAAWRTIHKSTMNEG